MAKQGLRSVVVKKYNHHANNGTVPDDKENILKRDFETETINQKWCTDITYIHVQKEGWTYLASVMDLCSRKIIGYAYGTSMTAELAVEAVKNACLNVRETKGIILHSDLVLHPTCNNTLHHWKNLLYSMKNGIGGRRHATLHCYTNKR